MAACSTQNMLEIHNNLISREFYEKKKSLKFGMIQYDILGLIEHGSLWVTFSYLKKFWILTIIFPVFHFKFNNVWKLFKADFPKNEKNLKNEKNRQR